MTGLAARSRADRVRKPLFVAAGIGLATIALRLRDPHQHASWGLCPSKVLTGWDCPGCGGLRAVNDLTYGRIDDAWHSNALFLSLAPLAIALWVVWFARSWSGGDRPAPPRLVRWGWTVLAVVALVFTIWRNTPAGSAYYAS